jgi:hypothetical protein
MKPERLIIFWNERLNCYTCEVQSTQELLDIPMFATFTELEDAMINLAAQYDIALESGDIAIDPKTEGGFAVWQKVS